MSYPFLMRRDHPRNSGEPAEPAVWLGLDPPALIIAALTAFFATMFVSLLVLRPEAPGTGEPTAGDSQPARPASPIESSGVEWHARDAALLHDEPPRVDAPPPEPRSAAESGAEPLLSPTLRAQLEELGVKCAEGADCYRD